MAKKKVETKKEVSREFIDADHIVITYNDGTTETRVV